MTERKSDIVWTVKVDKHFDEIVQEVMAQLGYKSKAELTREAVREFILRRKLFTLLGEDPLIPQTVNRKPNEARLELKTLLRRLSPEELQEEVKKARDDVEKAFFTD